MKAKLIGLTKQLEEKASENKFAEYNLAKMATSANLFFRIMKKCIVNPNESISENLAILGLFGDCSQILDNDIFTLISNPRKLTEREKSIVDMHPNKSVELLLEAGIGRMVATEPKTTEILSKDQVKPTYLTYIANHHKTVTEPEYSGISNLFLLSTAIVSMSMPRPDRSKMSEDEISRQLETGISKGQFSPNNVAQFFEYIKGNDNWQKEIFVNPYMFFRQTIEQSIDIDAWSR